MDIKVLAITEKTDKKAELLELLHAKIPSITTVETLLDGLNTIKRFQYDLAIISADMDDYYHLEGLVRALKQVGSIRKTLLITEKEKTIDAETPYWDGIILIQGVQQACTAIIQETRSLSDFLQKEKTLQQFGPTVIDTSPLPLSDGVPLGLYRINPDGTFDDVNKTMCQLLRAPGKEAVLADNFFNLFNDTEEQTVWEKILSRDGSLQGFTHEIERYDGNVIWVRDNAWAYKDDQQNVLYYYGSIEDITSQKDLENKLSFLATQDILTGLPNKNAFFEQANFVINQARYNQDIVCLLHLDLDFFTDINYVHGTKTGDRLLQIVAKRIRLLLRKNDYVFRLGGDKFIVLINGIKTLKDVFIIAKKLQNTFASPFVVHDFEINLSGSIGISAFPENGDDVATLLKNAEIATFAVKERQRGGYLLYTDEINIGYRSHAKEYENE
jgi:diguanylate cyclase (GGDEF)-like protein/PAS domain S-box-containing protein